MTYDPEAPAKPAEDPDPEHVPAPPEAEGSPSDAELLATLRRVFGKPTPPAPTLADRAEETPIPAADRAEEKRVPVLAGRHRPDAEPVSEDEFARRYAEEPATAHLPDESIRGLGLVSHPRYRP